VEAVERAAHPPAILGAAAAAATVLPFLNLDSAASEEFWSDDRRTDVLPFASLPPARDLAHPAFTFKGKSAELWAAFVV